MPDRAVASPVAVALLLLVVVAAAGILGAAALGIAETPTVPERVAIDASAAPSGRVVLVHRGGATLDVRDLDVRVTVDGEPLDRQPPVPFFSTRGFRPGPTGPFNSASDPHWSVGESASFQIAATNHPPVAPGSTVEIELRYRDQPAGRASVTVPTGSTDHRAGGVLSGLDRPPPPPGFDAGPATGHEYATAPGVATPPRVTTPLEQGRYSGTCATEVMAISGLYEGPIVRCSTSR